MPKRLLLISQVYVPDPAAVGQYLADAAEAMTERGWDVRVITADHGYEDPSRRFPSRETQGRVSIRRTPFSSLGKSSLWRRLAAQLIFCVQAFFHGVLTPRMDAVLVTTSPPMGGIAGWAIGLFRRIPVKYWVMDINPDQAVVLKQVQASSPMARLLEWGNRRILARASDVVVLDSYMEATMRRKSPRASARFHSIPPWPMETRLERVEHADNPFRREQGLDGKFVVMYSGNHSMAHPLDTLFEAALRLRDREDIVFMFIGGGVGKQGLEALIEREQPGNICSLPYQPLDAIKYSLSAADLHVVAMGDEMSGIVHPCKYYGAMLLGKPFLLLGPRACHLADVIEAHQCGWRVDHGDVDGAEALVRSLAAGGYESLRAKGEAGRRAASGELSRARLSAQFCDVLESAEYIRGR